MWLSRAQRSVPILSKYCLISGGEAEEKRSFPCEILFEVATKALSRGLSGTSTAQSYTFIFFTTFQPEYRQDEIYNVPFHLTHNLTLRPLWVLKYSRYFCSWKETLNRVKMGSDGVISHILKCHRQKESHDGFLEAAMSSFWSSLENVKSSSVQCFFLKAQLLQQLNLNMESTHQLHLLLINGGFGSSSPDSYLKWYRELLMAREYFWRNNDRMLSDCDQKGWKHLNTVGRH